jgi:alkylation response protein AidB-like acyl-CoA dehydrogenase
VISFLLAFSSVPFPAADRHGGVGGVLWGLFGGLAIGLPPILQVGTEEMRKRVATPCLTGQKFICLAITEPSAGSDVANIKTTAKLTPDGKHYIVNGEKKWITNGVFADYFTTCVRTGGEGMGGISLLLIERGPGVKTTQMKCQGVWASGTTYVEFDDVKVPVENLIGKENEGFKVSRSDGRTFSCNACCNVELC